MTWKIALWGCLPLTVGETKPQSPVGVVPTSVGQLQGASLGDKYADIWGSGHQNLDKDKMYIVVGAHLCCLLISILSSYCTTDVFPGDIMRFRLFFITRLILWAKTK